MSRARVSSFNITDDEDPEISEYAFGKPTDTPQQAWDTICVARLLLAHAPAFSSFTSADSVLASLGEENTNTNTQFTSAITFISKRGRTKKYGAYTQLLTAIQQHGRVPESFTRPWTGEKECDDGEDEKRNTTADGDEKGRGTEHTGENQEGVDVDMESKYAQNIVTTSEQPSATAETPTQTTTTTTNDTSHTATALAPALEQKSPPSPRSSPSTCSCPHTNSSPDTEHAHTPPPTTAAMDASTTTHLDAADHADTIPTATLAVTAPIAGTDTRAKKPEELEQKFIDDLFSNLSPPKTSTVQTKSAVIETTAPTQPVHKTIIDVSMHTESDEDD